MARVDWRKIRFSWLESGTARRSVCGCSAPACSSLWFGSCRSTHFRSANRYGCSAASSLSSSPPPAASIGGERSIRRREHAALPRTRSIHSPTLGAASATRRRGNDSGNDGPRIGAGNAERPALVRARRPRLAVHPLSIRRLRLVDGRWLRSGFPTSPGEFGLRLLPSGPDRVRRSPPRGTLPSTPRVAASPEAPDLEGEFNPAKAGCGFRAPPAPHLARPF